MKFKSNYDHPVTIQVGSRSVRFDAYGEYETDDTGEIVELKASGEVSRVSEPKPEPKPEVKAEEPQVEAPLTKDKKGSVKSK